MDAQVLVLNSGYMPVDIVPWWRAMTDVFSGRAVVEDTYEGMFIRTPSMSIPLPSVIRFVTRMAGMFRRGVKFNRKNVWLRDRGVCQYCGRKVPVADFTFDHVVPRCQGGRSVWENVVVACQSCNQRKQDRTPERAGMRLLAGPVKPKSVVRGWMPGWSEGMPSSWKDYISSVRWWTDKIEE